MSSDELGDVDALLRRASNDVIAAPADAGDRVDRLMRAIPQPPRWLRAGLAGLVVLQLPFVLPWLANVDPFGLLAGAEDTHLVRDGAFGLVILVAAGLTAWRPRWAVPSFAIASVALVAQLAAGFVDDSLSASGWNEAVHLLLLVTTLVIGSCGLRLTPLAPSRSLSRSGEGNHAGSNVSTLSDRRR